MADMLQTALAAPSPALDIATPIQEGLKTGMQLASVQQQMEAQKQQMKAQQEDLQQKQTLGLGNHLKAVAFAPSSAHGVLLDRAERYAQNAQIPFDRGGFEAAIKDPDMKIALQKGTRDVLNGKVPPQEFFNIIGSAPELLQALEPYIHQNAMEQSKLQQAMELKKASLDVQRRGQDIRKESTMSRMDNMIHARNISNAKKDEVLKKRLMQINNLDNAVAAFSQGDVPTGQQFNEMQQSVRSNLGIKGQSGLEERDKTMIKAAGLDLAQMIQFLTGTPQDVTKYVDPKLLNHLMSLVDVEKANIRKQAEQRINFITKGHASLYAKNPTLRDDLLDFQSMYGEQFGLSPTAGQAGAPAPAPATGAPTAAPAPAAAPKSFDKASFIKDAKAKGATDDQIAQYLAAKGVK